MVDHASIDLREVDRGKRMNPEVQAVKVDIYLAARVDLCLATEKWDQVANISRHLAEKYPDQPQWWVHWANALKNMEKVKEAKEVAMRGLKMHPGLAVLHFNIACYDALLGKLRSARKRLNRAIKRNPRMQGLSLNDPDLVGLQVGVEQSKSE